MESLQGRLLIANGNLFDPNFRQTVVLIAEHNEEGAVGIVLNRPAPVTVAEAAPTLMDLVGPEAPIFLGGPVQPQGAAILASFDRPDFLNEPIFDCVGLVGAEVEPAAVAGMKNARVYAGHAGWGPGQLEMELETDSWIIEDAIESDVFAIEPQALWREVLTRKGNEYALLALMPFDPSLN